MQGVQIDQLFGLEFREAVNAFACCWRERPDLRAELLSNLNNIIPALETWPREKGELSAVRLLLNSAREREFPVGEARRLYSNVVGFLDESGENIGKSLVNPGIIGGIQEIEEIAAR